MMVTLFDQERETELYLEEVAREAREKAHIEGHAEGLAEGLAEGRAEGRAEGLALSVKSLMENMGMTTDDALDALGIIGEDRFAVLDKL